MPQLTSQFFRITPTFQRSRSFLTAEPLASALLTATHTGLRLSFPDSHRPWARVSCPACGGTLDLPLTGNPVTPARAARRVDAFLFRHRPGRVHR